MKKVLLALIYQTPIGKKPLLLLRFTSEKQFGFNKHASHRLRRNYWPFSLV